MSANEDYLEEMGIEFNSPEEANEILKRMEGYYDPSQLDLEQEIEKVEQKINENEER